MTRLPRTTAIAAAAISVLLLGLAQPAHADPVTCSVEGVTPDQVTVGVSPTEVQFAVSSDCDGTDQVSWAMTSDVYPGSSGASWLMLRNYDGPPGKFTYVEDPDGRFTMNLVGDGTFQGNAMAGNHPLNGFAFHDADGDGLVDADEPTTSFSRTLLLQRRTALQHLNAAPEPRRVGQKITVKASLIRADWDTGDYTGFDTTAALQFKPATSTHYTTVKSVPVDDGVVTTRVTVDQSGRWRYRFAGDLESAPSTSTSDYVKVT